jgi:crotonobetainyl-CoA:carnitine CoA-transferase CaiB-like acyl-CoA transferase
MRASSPTSTRIAHRAELHEILEAATRAASGGHWIDALSAVNVPCAPIYDMQQLFDDPHVQGPGAGDALPHASGVDVPVLRSPLRLSASPVHHRAPPMLGQHTVEVLGGTLGKSATEIERLRTSGAIGVPPG